MFFNEINYICCIHSQIQNADNVRENEMAAKVAADIASQMINENHAPIQGDNKTKNGIFQTKKFKNWQILFLFL